MAGVFSWNNIWFSPSILTLILNWPFPKVTKYLDLFNIMPLMDITLYSEYLLNHIDYLSNF